MQSTSWSEDLNNLVEMEMKLRLLDLENVEIPEESPPIPPEPPGYQFRYNFNWSFQTLGHRHILRQFDLKILL